MHRKISRTRLVYGKQIIEKNLRFYCLFKLNKQTNKQTIGITVLEMPVAILQAVAHIAQLTIGLEHLPSLNLHLVPPVAL
jgi:hypothetical protein